MSVNAQIIAVANQKHSETSDSIHLLEAAHKEHIYHDTDKADATTIAANKDENGSLFSKVPSTPNKEESGRGSYAWHPSSAWSSAMVCSTVSVSCSSTYSTTLIHPTAK